MNEFERLRRNILINQNKTYYIYQFDAINGIQLTNTINRPGKLLSTADSYTQGGKLYILDGTYQGYDNIMDIAHFYFPSYKLLLLHENGELYSMDVVNPEPQREYSGYTFDSMLVINAWNYNISNMFLTKNSNVYIDEGSGLNTLFTDAYSNYCLIANLYVNTNGDLAYSGGTTAIPRKYDYIVNVYDTYSSFILIGAQNQNVYILDLGEGVVNYDTLVPDLQLHSFQEVLNGMNYGYVSAIDGDGTLWISGSNLMGELQTGNTNLVPFSAHSIFKNVVDFKIYYYNNDYIGAVITTEPLDL